MATENSDRAAALRIALIRNIDAIPKQREVREPLYPDSGKYLARAEGPLNGATHVFGRIRHAAGDIDYWEGEP